MSSSIILWPHLLLFYLFHLNPHQRKMQGENNLQGSFEKAASAWGEKKMRGQDAKLVAVEASVQRFPSYLH